MRSVLTFLWITVLALVASGETTTGDFNENTIDTTQSVRLDPYIRKALIKALKELEDGENFSISAEHADGTPTGVTAILGANDSLPTATPKEEIKIHSFVVNGQAAFANISNSKPTPIGSKISIIGTTAGNVENQVSATIPTELSTNDIFQARDTSVNIQQVRSIQSSTKSNTFLHNKDDLLKSSSTTPIITSTTTSTTTTPKPTHNGDGENIEDVDKRDVQVFPAPLVAAFTVQQDELGQPKKVIPIIQPKFQEVSKPFEVNNFQSNILPQTFGQSIPSLQPDFISQQLALQKQLEEKQRILEEQLRFLQSQQREQEELLRKQQYLLQQKEFQRQQQILLEQQHQKQQLLTEQQRLQSNQNINNLQLQGIQKNIQQTHFLTQGNGLLQTNSQVTIQPSVTLDASTAIANQQLPNREAVDFLLHLRKQQAEQFPLQQNHLPQGISSFLSQRQPSALQNFQQLPFEDPFRTRHGNRVFRQEVGVGNFGVNNNQQNYNRFDNFGSSFTNRFNFVNRPNQYNNDAQLKQLLAQSGLSGRSQEDLNIVSKVLSLNHGISLNNLSSNRLSFDSRRHSNTFN